MVMDPKKLARKILPKASMRLAEETYRKGRGVAVQARYGFPARKLKVIGVTGTNGKTTTCHFINEMLKASGFSTAMFTTAEIEVNGRKTPNKTNRTVVLTAELFGLLRRAAQEKVDYVVLEVTSQALHQHKLKGIPIEVAVMTNLTQDHLDYHQTMEHYATAKARLFNGYMKPKLCVLNRDDEWYSFFASEAWGKVISYGSHPGSSLHIDSVSSSSHGSRVLVSHGGKSFELETGLIGGFNAYNAVAAAAVGLALGIRQPKIIQGIASLKSVPGRMEAVDAGQPFTVLVDYAVTPDAISNALTTLRETTKGKVHIVFGATGDRDRSKRPIMGRIASELADRIYLTDEETYTENGEAIRAAIYKGIREAGNEAKTLEIPDRREAIRTAFKAAKPGDTVLLTGIGHQSYRNMGGHKEPWDERQVAREILKNS